MANALVIQPPILGTPPIGNGTSLNPSSNKYMAPKFRYETDRKIVEIPDIEAILFDRGFVPTDRIVTQDEQGRPVVKYIKVITNRGHRAFIDPDTEGLIKPMETQKIMRQVETVSSIPYSIKNGSLECASNIACGIAYECQDEVCVLRKDDLTPKEVVFSTEPVVTRVGSVNYISYPIVKLSDIMAEPEQVLEDVAEVSQRLQVEERSKCLEDTVKTNKSFGQMANKYNEMVSRYQLAFEILRGNISLLKDFQQKTSSDNSRTKLILLNLSRRYDLQNDLFKMCDRLNHIQNNFDQLSSEISEINELLKQSYNNLDQVFTE